MTRITRINPTRVLRVIRGLETGVLRPLRKRRPGAPNRRPTCTISVRSCEALRVRPSRRESLTQDPVRPMDDDGRSIA